MSREIASASITLVPARRRLPRLGRLVWRALVTVAVATVFAQIVLTSETGIPWPVLAPAQGLIITVAAWRSVLATETP